MKLGIATLIHGERQPILQNTIESFTNVNKLIEDGYQIQEIIDYMFKIVYINKNNKLSYKEQFEFLNIITKTYYLIENVSTSLQLYNMINLLLKII